MSDLIRRSDVIKTVCTVDCGIMTERCEELTLGRHCKVYNALSALPSTEPKTGKWIDRSDGGRILNPWWESCECDQCGDYGSGAWGFCPSCGARMMSDEE